MGKEWDRTYAFHTLTIQGTMGQLPIIGVNNRYLAPVVPYA